MNIKEVTSEWHNLAHSNAKFGILSKELWQGTYNLVEDYEVLKTKNESLIKECELYAELKNKYNDLAKVKSDLLEEFNNAQAELDEYKADIKDYKREIQYLEAEVAINRAKVEAYESVIKMVKELK